MPTTLLEPKLQPVKVHIVLSVARPDADSAGEAALAVLDQFLAEVAADFTAYEGLTLEVEAPTARKGVEGSFDVICQLRLSVPSDLRRYGMPSAAQSLRQILFNALRKACDQYHADVVHARSFIGAVRPYNPEEERAAAEAAVPAAPKEMLAIKVMLKGQLLDVQVAKGGNLLDECLDHGAELGWQCKAGVCDSCKVLVKGGMANLSEVTDAERNMLEDLIDKGYRLSCQCVLSGPVEIEQ